MMYFDAWFWNALKDTFILLDFNSYVALLVRLVVFFLNPSSSG
jgi:hypothetical protein